MSWRDSLPAPPRPSSPRVTVDQSGAPACSMRRSSTPGASLRASAWPWRCCLACGWFPRTLVGPPSVVAGHLVRRSRGARGWRGHRRRRCASCRRRGPRGEGRPRRADPRASRQGPTFPGERCGARRAGRAGGASRGPDLVRRTCGASSVGSYASWASSSIVCWTSRESLTRAAHRAYSKMRNGSYRRARGSRPKRKVAMSLKRSACLPPNPWLSRRRLTRGSNANPFSTRRLGFQRPLQLRSMTSALPARRSPHHR